MNCGPPSRWRASARPPEAARPGLVRNDQRRAGGAGGRAAGAAAPGHWAGAAGRGPLGWRCTLHRALRLGRIKGRPVMGAGQSENQMRGRENPAPSWISRANELRATFAMAGERPPAEAARPGLVRNDQRWAGGAGGQAAGAAAPGHWAGAAGRAPLGWRCTLHRALRLGRIKGRPVMGASQSENQMRGRENPAPSWTNRTVGRHVGHMILRLWTPMRAVGRGAGRQRPGAHARMQAKHTHISGPGAVRTSGARAIRRLPRPLGPWVA